MPDDLEMSLRLIPKWCRGIGLGDLSAEHEGRLHVAGVWVGEQHVVIKEWLGGTLRVLEESSASMPAGSTRHLSVADVHRFGELVASVAPDVVELSRRHREQLPSAAGGGKVEITALDYTRHVVRVACRATIDRY
ncbi:hypothetical protein [Kineococcus sp. G2]|uniref:hypothetical protein n=1 Tax=Kineococcus sp. G2 TaxID=3127484 RepID=UPI00301D5E8B